MCVHNLDIYGARGGSREGSRGGSVYTDLRIMGAVGGNGQPGDVMTCLPSPQPGATDVEVVMLRSNATA